MTCMAKRSSVLFKIELRSQKKRKKNTLFKYSNRLNLFLYLKRVVKIKGCKNVRWWYGYSWDIVPSSHSNIVT
ncbi:CLUMA_CG021518, isoform A [Clunio marinus]|uniref:CLUMA_CG021518, isoform A n=1 Tax=Clunio marinus TaxID=568069 RepID=A0A1J1JAC6_9DIPT|nr:CLUMA_CG021518, isoform A [Clunio marinus]